MRIPQPRVALPSDWMVPHELLALQPITQSESALVAALRDTEAYITANCTAAIDAHTVMVLQHAYCDRVKGQLAAKERKAEKGKGHTQLLGDGLRHVLTHDEFMARHDAHNVEVQVKEDLQWQQRRVRPCFGLPCVPGPPRTIYAPLKTTFNTQSGR